MNKELILKGVGVAATLATMFLGGKEYGHSQGVSQAKEACTNTVTETKVVVPQYVKCPPVVLPKQTITCGPLKE